jgi:DNA-binding ferritin-like protein
MTTPPRKRASAKRAPAKSRSQASSSAAASTESQDAPATDAPAKQAKAPEETAATAAEKPKSSAKAEAPAAFMPPPARTASAARVLAWLTLAIGVCVGTAAFTWPQWSPYLVKVFPHLATADAGAPVIDELAGRVQALEQEKTGTLHQLEQERARFQDELKTLMARLAEVEQAVAEARNLVKAAEAPASTAAAAESLKVLSERLAELEGGGGQVGALAARIEEIEKAKTDAGQGTAPAAGPDPKVTAALDAMAERLKRLEQETDGKAADFDGAAARAIVLATAQLRDAVREGTPFTADLEALKALAAGRPAITQILQTLTPHADLGVSTLAVLRTRFATLAGPIVNAAGAAEGDGWFAEAAARLASLVTIRRVGNTAPDDSIDALVSRVDALLSAGDLRSAVEALMLLKGKPAEVVAPWLRSAEARLAAEKAVANLHVHALSLIAPAKAGG